MKGSKAWLTPLTGVAFVVLLIVGFAIGGEPPDAGDPVNEIVEHYADNKDNIQLGVLILTLATVFLVYFGSYLRKVLDEAPGESGILSTVTFAGTVVFAIGGAIDGTIAIAISEAVDDIEPTSVQTLQALWDNDFVPFALGINLFIISAGLSTLLHGGLPKWLGWVALLIGVVSVTPVGFAAFPLTGLWILVTSIMLSLRARSATA